VARAFGATTAVAADVSDNQLAAVSPWVDATLNATGLDPTEVSAQLRSLAGAEHGVDIAFETAGILSSVNAMVRVIRPGGSTMLVGIVDGSAALVFDSYLSDFVRREVNLVTTFGFTRKDFLVGNALYLADRLDVSPLVGPTATLAEVPGVLAHIEEHGTGGKRYVVDVGMNAS